MQPTSTTLIPALLLLGSERQLRTERTENPRIFKKQCKKEDDFKFALKALVHIKALRVFDLSQSVMGPWAARHFAIPLMKNENIQVLNFNKCHIEPVHARILFEALKTNSALKIIDIGYNPIQDEGAAAIAGFLETNKSVTAMDLTNCEITHVGAEALGNAIRINTLLRVLFLSKNNLGDKGAVAIANGLQLNHSIEELNMRICNIGNLGAARLGAVIAAKANCALNLLWLSHNKIHDEGGVAICKAVGKQKLKGFSIEHNPLSFEGTQDCMHYLEEAGTKFSIGGSGNFMVMYCDPKDYVRHSPTEGNTPRKRRIASRQGSPRTGTGSKPSSPTGSPPPDSPPSGGQTSLSPRDLLLQRFPGRSLPSSPYGSPKAASPLASPKTTLTPSGSETSPAGSPPDKSEKLNAKPAKDTVEGTTGGGASTRSSLWLQPVRTSIVQNPVPPSDERN